MALDHVGEHYIQNLDEDESINALACNTHFEMVRDRMLQSAEWDFAVSRVTLARLSDTPINGYDYAYVLPTDHLRSLKINDTEAYLLSQSYSIERFKVDGDTTGVQRLLCDWDSVKLKYISRVDDVAEWSPAFADAFTWGLAQAIALKLTGSEQTRSECEKKYFYFLGEALRHDANQGKHQRKPRAWQKSGLVRAHQRHFSDRPDLLYDPFN